MAVTHRDLFAAGREGRELIRPWCKTVTIATTAGVWTDLTCFGKYPAANFFTDGEVNTARALYRSVDGGIDHGDDKGDDYLKFITGFAALSVTPGANPLTYLLMDYLLYYPLISMEDVQELGNTATLPRYADGHGVQMMLVEQFPYVGSGTIQITYTNSDGTAGRNTPVTRINYITQLGTLATCATATSYCAGPFVPLAAGDKGVMSVQSINFLAPDTGIVALVLVKPMCPAAQYENASPAIWDFWLNTNQLSRVYDDAYLSMICRPAGSMSGAILDGYLITTWYEA
jgi:hypothetical protein